MSDKNKFKQITSRFLVALLLILLVTSKSISLAHSFSHSLENSAKAAVVDQNFLEKLIFSHGKTKAPKNLDDCFLCSAANLQNQTLISASLIFAVAIFYLSFFSRIFNRVKFSYLTSSYFSQAPPLNS